MASKSQPHQFALYFLNTAQKSISPKSEEILKPPKGASWVGTRSSLILTCIMLIQGLSGPDSWQSASKEMINLSCEAGGTSTCDKDRAEGLRGAGTRTASGEESSCLNSPQEKRTKENWQVFWKNVKADPQVHMGLQGAMDNDKNPEKEEQIGRTHTSTLITEVQ